MENRICENDWVLFDWRVRDQLDIFFANIASKLDNLTSILAFTICIFGAAANSVHLQVLGSRYMPSTAVNRILFWIALCDLVTVFSCIITYIGLFFNSKQCSRIFGETLGQVRWLMVHVFVTIYMHSVGLWLVVSMAFVRFMALRRVRISSRWITPKRAKRIIWIILLLVLPFCVSTVLLYEPQATPVDSREVEMFQNECSVPQNGTRYWLQIRNFEQLTNKQLCLVLKSHLWVSGMGCKVLPCLLLSALSIMLWRRLKRQASSRRHKFSQASSRSQLSLNRWSRREKCTNVAIASIMIIFLVTELPQGVLTLLSGLFIEDVYFHVYGWVGPYLDLLSLINCTVNFIIMVATSSDYRQAFRFVIYRESSPPDSRSGTTRTALLEMADRGSKLSDMGDYGSRFSETATNMEITTKEDEVWL